MKNIFIAVLLLTSLTLSAQITTTYLDKNGKTLAERSLAAYYTENYKADSLFVVKTFWMDGTISSRESFSDPDKKIREGTTKSWYKNRVAKLEEEYSKGILTERHSYYENGALKRKEIYAGGKLTEGHCYKQDGKENRYFDYIIQPQFPGGDSAMLEFVKTNVHYPEDAKLQAISGKVVVSFVVDADGYIVDAWIRQPANALLDAEALRMVNSMPRWKGGQTDGEATGFTLNLPVSYILK